MNKKNIIIEKLKTILPSRKFTVIIIIIATLGIIFLVFFFLSGRENFVSKKDKAKIANQTILQLVQTDTDGDTIPDWEEALWGTDKNKKQTFDVPDIVYVENKKKELKLGQDQNLNESQTTETDKFAQQFFSSYVALKDSGGADKKTINSFSNALGQKIVNPALIDKYKEKDVKLNPIDNAEEQDVYYLEISLLFAKYKDAGLGNELDIVSTGLASVDETGNSKGNYSELLLISDAYLGFADEVMKLSVPESLSTYHLQIANAANNTGISVSNMTKISNDPIIGLTGLSQYQKYSEDLTKSVKDLEAAITTEDSETITAPDEGTVGGE